MRKINTRDVFKLARIINALQIKDVMQDMFSKGLRISRSIVIPEDASIEEKEKIQEEYEQKQEEFGVNTIFTILEKCSDVRTEEKIYDLLGGILEKKPDDVANQTLDATINDIKAIAKENNLFDFFKKASQLTQ